MEMAGSLARGLAASGVTVASSLSDGIAVAAQAGALEVDGRTLTVMDGGLDVACPRAGASCTSACAGNGCAVAELPCGFGARRNSWCHTARERIVAGLAELTIVVEADEGSDRAAGRADREGAGADRRSGPGARDLAGVAEERTRC